MSRIAHRLLVILGGVLTLTSGLSLAAHAQSGTSSWSHRTKPQTPSSDVPRGTGGTRKPVVPLRQTVTAGGKQRRKPLGPATAPASGENAAYIAFDQGQYLTALKLAAAAAKKGDATAHTLVARIHAEGLGVPKNEKLAAQWYEQAAKLGDTEAMFAWGVMLAAGTGVKKDRARAADLFEKAAMKGHAYAHYNLGLLFLTGDGKPENPRRAALHLEYAASRGILEAQYDLATLYQKGHGVDADAFKAAYWIRQAAARGHPAAQYDYAIILLRGQGLNEDRPLAVDYLRNSAARGLPGAQNRLAHIYLEGKLVNRDELQAAKWRLLARTSGVKDDALDAVIAKLPAKVRRAAETEAQSYQERQALELPDSAPK